MWFLNKVDSITPAELEKRLSQPNIRLIDVRRPDEYAQRHIRQAKNVPYEELDQFKDTDKTTPLHIICKGGVRSLRSAKKLKDRGYNVINVLEGMDGYHGPTVTGGE